MPVTEIAQVEPRDKARDVAVDAVDILNDLLNDLTSAAGIYRSLMARKAEGLVGFQQHVLDRVVMGHMTIAIFKVDELLSHPTYARSLGDKHVEWRRAVRKQIAERQLAQFRNTYAGHIHCRERKRPLRTSEMEDLRNKVMGGDMDAFVSWVVDGEQCVRALLYALRASLEEEYLIKPEEILDR